MRQFVHKYIQTGKLPRHLITKLFKKLVSLVANPTWSVNSTHPMAKQKTSRIFSRYTDVYYLASVRDPKERSSIPSTTIKNTRKKVKKKVCSHGNYQKNDKNPSGNWKVLKNDRDRWLLTTEIWTLRREKITAKLVVPRLPKRINAAISCHDEWPKHSNNFNPNCLVVVVPHVCFFSLLSLSFSQVTSVTYTRSSPDEIFEKDASSARYASLRICIVCSLGTSMCRDSRNYAQMRESLADEAFFVFSIYYYYFFFCVLFLKNTRW